MDNVEEFYYNQILRQINPIPGEFIGTGGVALYTEYLNVSLIGKSIRWSVFV